MGLEEQLLKQLSTEIQKDIDRAMIEELWGIRKFRLIKSWRDRRGRRMHRVRVNSTVLNWLAEEHSQQHATNPEWWKFEGNTINITDRLYTLLVLKFSE